MVSVVAVEGGSVADGCLTVGGCHRGIDAVLDGQRAIAGVAHEAAAERSAVGGENLAVEHATVDGELGTVVVGLDGHKAAMGAVAADAADDGRADAAVLDERGAIGTSYQAGAVAVGGGDGAVDMQVLDGGIRDEAERRNVVLGSRRHMVEGQRVAVAVEDAFEGPGILGRSAGAQHRADGDVGIELEVLAVVVVASSHIGRQLVPVVFTADDVRGLGRPVAATEEGGIVCPCSLHEEAGQGEKEKQLFFLHDVRLFLFLFHAIVSVTCKITTFPINFGQQSCKKLLTEQIKEMIIRI